LATTIAEDAQGELTEVRAACVNWGNEAEKRFCPPTVDIGGRN
jgi:hypothetical protein